MNPWAVVTWTFCAIVLIFALASIAVQALP